MLDLFAAFETGFVEIAAEPWRGGGGGYMR